MKKILVVDDDKTLRTILTHYLEKHGYVVKDVSSGIEALSVFEQDPPDLVVSDVMMPDMDGLEFCRRLRASRFGQLVPFIFLSAKGELQDRIEEEAREQGAGGRGDSSGGDSTPPEREPLIRSGGLRPMFRSASQQGEWVISPRSLPPSPCLFVEGHTIGGDDYLTKPFELRELVAKIESQLERSRRTHSQMVQLMQQMASRTPVSTASTPPETLVSEKESNREISSPLTLESLSLTPAEARVFWEVIQGLTNKILHERSTTISFFVLQPLAL